MASSCSKDWKNWAIDPQFLASLAEWNQKHPEGTLDKILDKISKKIEIASDYTFLIPDTPFPARSLVEGLSKLVQLGVSMKIARTDVKAFVDEIIGWVGREVDALKPAGSHRFTDEVCNNLQEMRAIIDEICLWAAQKLRDKWWQRIGHGSIEDEISEYKARLNDASVKFQRLSIITTAKGLDILIKEIRDCSAKLQAEEQRIAQLLDSKEQNAREQYIKRMLDPFSASDATYAKQSKGICHQNTRLELLSDIQAWIDTIADDTPRFLWITGQPGAGKSSVIATICHRSKDKAHLVLEYFMSRAFTSTINPNHIFPTIALQLRHVSPEVALLIHDTIRKRPTIVDRFSAEQATELFLKPLLLASKVDPMKPLIVAIDALDESDIDLLYDIAEVLSAILLELPNNVKVAISSRAESDIHRHFTYKLERLKRIDLDTRSVSSAHDVAVFIEDEMKKMAIKFKIDPLKWPGESRLAQLSGQASGLFIWAVTAIRYIHDQLMGEYKNRKKPIKDLLPDQLKDLNKLYHTILDKGYPASATPSAFQDFRDTVGSIVVLGEPLCLSELADLLVKHSDEGCPGQDDEEHEEQAHMIKHVVERFRTVLVPGTEEINDHTIPRLHRSFFEFITGDQVDSRFRADLFTSNKFMARQCFRRFQELNRSIAFYSIAKHPGRHIWDNDIEKGCVQHLKYLHATISCYENFVHDGRVSPLEKPSHIFSLALALSFRSQLLQRVSDLETSILQCDAAIRLESDAYPDKQDMINTLCNLIDRRVGDYYFDLAITKSTMNFKSSMELIPNSHPRKPHVLSTLGNWLTQRFYSSREPDDIHNAIDVHEHALKLATHPPHPQNPKFLVAFGMSLSWRYDLLSNKSDIDKSILAYGDALKAMFTKDSNRPKTLLNLSHPLSIRISWTYNKADIRQSLSLYNDLISHRNIEEQCDILELLDCLLDRHLQYDPELKPLVLFAFASDAFSRRKYNGVSSSRSLSAKRTELPKCTNAQQYIHILQYTRSDHINKPKLLTSLAEFYVSRQVDIQNAISAVEWAILLVRKFGYPHGADLQATRPMEPMEEELTTYLLELRARRDHRKAPANNALVRAEINQDLDHDMFRYVISCPREDLILSDFHPFCSSNPQKWKENPLASRRELMAGTAITRGLVRAPILRQQRSSRGVWFQQQGYHEVRLIETFSTASAYFSELQRIPDGHPSKPLLVAALGELYAEESDDYHLNQAIAAYKIALLLLRAFPSTRKKQKKVDPSYENHVLSRERSLVTRLMEIISGRDKVPCLPVDLDYNQFFEITGELDCQLLSEVRWREGDLTIADLDPFRFGFIDTKNNPISQSYWPYRPLLFISGPKFRTYRGRPTLPTAKPYIEALQLLRNDHPDKPSMLVSLGNIYAEAKDTPLSISAYALAILFVRKFGWSQKRHTWKYSPTAEYHARNPRAQEKKYTIQLIEAISGRDNHPFEVGNVKFSHAYEIVGLIDEDLFFDIRTQEGDLRLCHFDDYRQGRPLDGLPVEIIDSSSGSALKVTVAGHKHRLSDSFDRQPKSPQLSRSEWLDDRNFGSNVRKEKKLVDDGFPDELALGHAQKTQNPLVQTSVAALVLLLFLALPYRLLT